MRRYISVILIIFTIILIILPSFSYGEVIIPENEFNSYKGDGAGSSRLSPIVNSIAGVVASIGAIVSVIVLIIVGIKYMLGSVEERAEYKKTMILYIIGAVLVFSMTTVPTIIYNIAKNL